MPFVIQVLLFTRLIASFQNEGAAYFVLPCVGLVD